MHRQPRSHGPRGHNACNRPCNGSSSTSWRTSASRPGAAEHGIHWCHVCRPFPCDLPFVRPSQCLCGRGRIAAGNLLVHADPDPGLGARTHSRRRTRPALYLPSLRPNATAPRSPPLSPLRPPRTVACTSGNCQLQPRSHVPSGVDRSPRHWVNAGVFPLTPITKRSTAGRLQRPPQALWSGPAGRAALSASGRHSGTNPAGKLHLCCTNRRRALGYAPLLSCPIGSPCPCASC